MPDLVLGPLLRYVGDTEATVWVETSAPCEVEVLGSTALTFQVAGHHYALVQVEGLAPGTTYEYGVALDGEPAWPEPGSRYPPSVIRTMPPDGPLEIAFGSCRVALPHEPPYTLRPRDDRRGRGVDALEALVLRLRGEPPERLPDLLLMLGDQVYADEGSPQVRAFIRSRRDAGRPPGDQVADFEEYTRLYHESWRQPGIRWLLSTVPNAMIFDDHELHDDWNISAPWVREMRAQPWWDDRVAGAFASYWIYQHVGNLTPDELARDELWRRVRAAGDAWPLLREFSWRAHRDTSAARWSFCRDLGRTRLVVIDSRAGRVLQEDGRRLMVDDGEWEWVERQATGDFDHLVLGTSLPLIMSPGVHGLEAWSSAVCDGAWGRRAVRVGEAIRQALDLEHWPAFGESFERFVRLLEEVASGKRGPPPATIAVLSGDVHYAYAAELGFRRGAGVRSAVYQAVSSPFRNTLPPHFRLIVRAGVSDAGAIAGWALARAAGVAPPPVHWRLLQEPVFANHLGMLTLDGRRARLRIQRAAGDATEHRLETAFGRQLA